MNREQLIEALRRLDEMRSEDELAEILWDIKEAFDDLEGVVERIFEDPPMGPEETADAILRLPKRRVLITPPPRQDG